MKFTNFILFLQISQAIKRHVRLGMSIVDGEDIQKAIQNIAGARISQLTPERESGRYMKTRLAD